MVSYILEIKHLLILPFLWANITRSSYHNKLETFSSDTNTQEVHSESGTGINGGIVRQLQQAITLSLSQNSESFAAKILLRGHRVDPSNQLLLCMPFLDAAEPIPLKN